MGAGQAEAVSVTVGIRPGDAVEQHDIGQHSGKIERIDIGA